MHVLPALSIQASGPSYTVPRICEELVSQGHDARLLAMDWNSHGTDIPFATLFPVGFGPRRLGRSPQMAKWIRERAASGHIDILHNHGMWQMNSLYPAWTARRFGVPLVHSPRGALSQWALRHGSPLKKPFWHLLQRPALEETTCFHATADSEYEDIRRVGLSQPVAIIPNGMDVPEMSAKRRSSDRSVLFLGRLHPKKGIDVLLRAWQSVQQEHPAWNLRVVGTDADSRGATGYLEFLKALSSELGLLRVEFVEPLYGSAKMSAYRDADVFVLPSHSENFGVTVAESLSVCTPTIVTKGAPWSGLVTEGAGWWIEHGVQPLVDSLREAMAMPDETRRQMGEHGRSWMQRDFAWPALSEKLAQTYSWLLDRERPKPDFVRLD